MQEMTDYDIEQMNERVANSLARELLADVGYKVRCFARSCESPIEVMFGAAFHAAWDLSAPHRGQHLWTMKDFSDEYEAVLLSQYQIDAWRVDFMFRWRPFKQSEIKFVFECDGHDFHERTKDQAARDKRRDRELLAAGYHVMRFTGSEIYRDAGGCARQAIDAINGEADRQTALIYPESVG